MQTLPLVNPCTTLSLSGGTDTNKSSPSQNPYLVDVSTNGFLAHAIHMEKNINKLSKKIGSVGEKGMKAMDLASRKVVGNPPDVKKHVGRGVASHVSGAAHRASSLVKMVVGAKKKTPQ